MADLLLSGPAELRRSPLAHLHDRFAAESGGGDRAVALRELPFLAMVALRVEPGSRGAGRLAARLGVALPERCGEVATAAGRSVLWLGPDEFLVVSDDESGPLVADLREALAGDPGSVVDVSANRTTLELSGPAARETLEKGCTIDLHPRSFRTGNAVATTLGPVPVLLWQTGESTYRLLPRSSFADYVARWLLDAVIEFSGPRVA
jgi:sarcosine oxidase, subunit gamma